MVTKELTQSADIIARDHDVLSPSYTRAYPFVMSHGLGAEVWDVDGNRYIDLTAGIAVTNTGHAHPDVVQAIKDQAEKFLHMCLSDFYYENAVHLAEKLASLAPFKNEESRIFFSNSGAEAIEGAIKLARYATERQHFISFYGAFHGRTMGALALTSSKSRQRDSFAPLMPGVTHVPYPNTFRPELTWDGKRDYGQVVVEHIEKSIFKRTLSPDQVAGIVVEPIQGESGYIVPPPGFLPALRDLCDRYGIMLICDEIQSGLGRTGKWWAVDHFDVEPDIMTVAKGLASGLPLGAIIARKSIMDWDPGTHGSTFGGNPVAIAAALESLRLTEDWMMDNAGRVGAVAMDILKNEIAPKHPILAEIRGLGLMIGIEVVEDPVSLKPAPSLRDGILNRLYTEGVLMFGAGESVLRIMPPLMIGEDLVRDALAVLDKVLTEVEQGL